MSEPVSISPNGGVCLGSEFVCDGFVFERAVRVQTHVHDDHMRAFGESKGYQDIYLSHATRKLIEAEYNADIEVRQNIKGIDLDACTSIRGHVLRLLPASHMLGAVQVELCLPDGTRVGYSGDIGWPNDQIISVDVLVVDSTNGSPNSIRQYSQESAELKFIELVHEKLRFGTVHITAHRGTLHRALQLLAGFIGQPVLASDRRLREIKVYQEFAYATPDIHSLTSTDGQRALRDGRCVVLYSKGDGKPRDYGRGDTTIVLSAFMCSGSEPFQEYSESSYRVAFSDHADYRGIVEYVAATGAQTVLVDGTRGGHGLELAQALRNELGIKAIESSGMTSREWGV